MIEHDYSSIRVTVEAKKTWDEFLARTHSYGTETFSQLMEQLQLLLDIMEDGKKLLFLFDFDNKNKMVHIRLSDALMSSFAEIDPEMRAEILKAFGYSTDGKFTDLREKPKEEKKDGEQE
jgi:hypothetical protein